MHAHVAQDGRDLLRAAAADAQARDIYLRTGEVYVEQGALQKAVTVYKNALKLSPGLAAVHLRLGALLERGGQPAEALQQFGLAAAAFQNAGLAGRRRRCPRWRRTRRRSRS